MDSSKNRADQPTQGNNNDDQSIAGQQSTNVSPTDTRHNQAPADSSHGRDALHPNLSESFQSTDTVRRRPEASTPSGYGTSGFVAE